MRHLRFFLDYILVSKDTREVHEVLEPQNERRPEGSDSLEGQRKPRKSSNIDRRDRVLAWIRERRGVLFNHGRKQCAFIEGKGVTDFSRSCPYTEYIVTNALGMSTALTEARDAVNFVRAWILEHAPTVTPAMFAIALPGRIYVPVRTGLLRISAEGVRQVRNIENEDRVWVTHPRDRPMAVDPGTYKGLCSEGLLAIEDRIVRRMSVKEPAMAWFLAINGIWAPFLRQLFGARFITLHTGPSQAGKTTAAQLLLDALDLGSVIGDSSTAGLHAHEIGLLVLDNLETENWTTDLVQFALHAATGARRIRASRFGPPTESSFDQIVFVTSIEGAPRVELRERLAVVEFQKSTQCLSRHEASSSVVAARECIHAAIVGTLELYLARAPHPRSGAALKNFVDHYAAICALMRCVGQLLGRPSQWAEHILEEWDCSLVALERVERRSDELEAEILNATRRLPEFQPFTFQGTPGRLFICSATELSRAMGAKNPSALARRLHGAHFADLRILTEREANDVPALKRTAHGRKMGLFVPRPHAPLLAQPMLLSVDPAQHPHLESSDRCHYLFDYNTRDDNPGLLNTLKLSASADLSDQQFHLVQELVVALRCLAPHYWTGALVVPVPNSAGSPTQVLRVMEAVGVGTVVPILNWKFPMTPRAKNISPEDLAQHITIEASLERAPERVVIVDDVLSTGLHFRAASIRLKESFPHIQIQGLFMYRNSSGRAAAAAV